MPRKKPKHPSLGKILASRPLGNNRYEVEVESRAGVRSTITVQAVSEKRLQEIRQMTLKELKKPSCFSSLTHTYQENSVMRSHIYDRFTDRARKVMQLALQEAQYFNHDSIEPEHVLLGLIKEGSGVGGHTLVKRFGLTLMRVRTEVEKIRPAGPDRIRDAPRNSPETHVLIDSTYKETIALDHNYAGTEHLLLALLALNHSGVVTILNTFGVDGSSVRQEVLGLLGKLPPSSPQLDPQSEKTIEMYFCELKVTLGNVELSDMEALQYATEVLGDTKRVLHRLFN